MRRAPPTTPRSRFLSMLKTRNAEKAWRFLRTPHRQILIRFDSWGDSQWRLKKQSEIGPILVATCHVDRRATCSFLHPPSYREEEIPWPVLGGSPVRCDSSATCAQSMVKLGLESDLHRPGALAGMTKLPADDTASSTPNFSAWAIFVLALATAIRDSPEI